MRSLVVQLIDELVEDLRAERRGGDQGTLIEALDTTITRLEQIKEEANGKQNASGRGTQRDCGTEPGNRTRGGSD